MSQLYHTRRCSHTEHCFGTRIRRVHSCGPPRAAQHVEAPKAVPHPLPGCAHPLTNPSCMRSTSANTDSMLLPSHDAPPLLLNNPCAPQRVGPYAPPLYVDVCPSVRRSIGANEGLRDKHRHEDCATGGRLRRDNGAGGRLLG